MNIQDITKLLSGEEFEKRLNEERLKGKERN